MMFNIVLQYSVTANDGIQSHWERKFQLPFVPWVGLVLSDPFVEEDGQEYTIERIYWSGNENAFIVDAEPDEFAEWNAGECEDWFVESGWRRV